MFPFGAIAATVWWRRGSGRVLGGIIETNEGPAFCQSAQPSWRNALLRVAHHLFKATALHHSTPPSFSPVVALLYLNLLNLYLYLKIRKEKCPHQSCAPLQSNLCRTFVLILKYV